MKKSIKVSQLQAELIENNKIIEHWRITDDLTMVRHLDQIKNLKN